jgi:putative heme iron utilization protein
MMIRLCAILAAALLLQGSTAFVPAMSKVLRATNSRLFEKLESEPLKTNAPGHEVRPSGPVPDMSPEDQERLQAQAQAYMEYQNGAPKLDWPTEIRTLVQYNHGYAVISTNSKAEEGYPSGSVVGFVPDENGNPLFLFSGMSTHTQDILVDPKASLTVAAKEFKGAADGRVNLMGTCSKLPKEEIPAAKELYLAKHPNSKVWINFGDFTWFRLTVEKIRFVGGFARAGSVTADQYFAAKPDPVAAFGAAIGGHMNEDHGSATLAMVKGLPGLQAMTLTAAEITSVDSLGMYVKVTREPGLSFQPEQFKLRLPFPRKAEDRKDVRTLIVDLTQAAAASAKN